MSKKIFGYFSQKNPRRWFSYFCLSVLYKIYVLGFFSWKLLTKNPNVKKVYKYSAYLFLFQLPRWFSGKEPTCQREPQEIQPNPSILCSILSSILLFFPCLLLEYRNFITPFYIYIWLIYTLSIFVILLGYTVYYSNHIYLQIFYATIFVG